MAKKRTPPPIRAFPVEEYRIRARMADFVLCPTRAIDEAYWRRNSSIRAEIRFITSDGVLVRPSFQISWDNSDGRYDEELDRECRERFKLPFTQIRSMWISRLDEIGRLWHLIKLEKV